ncbi:hypothetical protein CH293_15020 [Rhodococcus sp. 14-2470-1b]|nr:hypothetical protein CH293_15020 [Rhodococcus sp. 14-2470-1b]
MNTAVSGRSTCLTMCSGATVFLGAHKSAQQGTSDPAVTKRSVCNQKHSRGSCERACRVIDQHSAWTQALE